MTTTVTAIFLTLISIGLKMILKHSTDKFLAGSFYSYNHTHTFCAGETKATIRGLRVCHQAREEEKNTPLFFKLLSLHTTQLPLL